VEPSYSSDFLFPDPETRRRPCRRGGNRTLVRLTDSTGTTVRGCVLKYSTVGLHLRVERPIPTGRLVRVQACHSPAGDAAQATVRLCRRTKVLYEIGCEFTSRPRPSVLVQFG
jgi:hypothetical protein